MKTLIIIPHHSAHTKLATCLAGIDNTQFDIAVISGGSFAENCNRGALLPSEKLIFCNDDCYPSTSDLLQIATQLNVYDVVGTTQITGKGQKYYGIGFQPEDDNDKIIVHRVQLRKGVSHFPSGFLFGITRDAWSKLGGFNEAFKTGNEDVDFGIRCIELNLKMVLLDLEIKHDESSSIDRLKFCNENEKLFYKMYPQKALRHLMENPKPIKEL